MQSRKDELQRIVSEISTVTLRIERDHPELFRSLNETPVTVASSGSTEMNIQVLKDYLQSLKDMESRVEKGV
ncbi:MAG: hypothetical protein R2813_00580 [Flavobacteriales bacterium]